MHASPSEAVLLWRVARGLEPIAPESRIYVVFTDRERDRHRQFIEEGKLMRVSPQQHRHLSFFDKHSGLPNNAIRRHSIRGLFKTSRGSAIAPHHKFVSFTIKSAEELGDSWPALHRTEKLEAWQKVTRLRCWNDLRTNKEMDAEPVPYFALDTNVFHTSCGGKLYNLPAREQESSLGVFGRAVTDRRGWIHVPLRVAEEFRYNRMHDDKLRKEEAF